MSDSPYYPSLLATSVGGLQWGLSAAAIATVFVQLYVDYLLATGNYEPNGPIGPGPLPILVALVVGLVAGSLWVGRTTADERQETRDTRRRVEFLLVATLALPMVFVSFSFGLAILDPYVPTILQRFLGVAGPALVGIGSLLLASLLVYRQGFDFVTDWTASG
jgi:ABC-type amino acid transport system permease subunit